MKIAWTFNDQPVIEKFYLNVCAGDDEEMADKVGHDGARVMKKR